MKTVLFPTFFLIGGLSHPCMAEGTFDLRVGFHKSASVTVAEMKSVATIIADNAKDSCNEPTINIVSVSEAPSGFPAVVSAKNYQEMKPILKYGYSINVVYDFAYCGGKKSSFFTPVYGCSAEGGPITVKKRTSNSLFALIVAHEMGHGQGLSHVKPSSSLMNKGPTNWKLSQEECKSFFGKQLFAAGGEDTEGEEADEAWNAAEYLAAPWIHGPDIEILESHREELNALASEAIDQDNFEFWPNALTVIGLLRAPNATGRVLKVLNYPSSSVDTYTQGLIYEAKQQAVLSLGYLAYSGDFSEIEEIGLLRDLSDPAQVPEIIDLGAGGDENLLLRQARAEAISRRALVSLIMSRTEMGRAAIANARDRSLGNEVTYGLEAEQSEEFFSYLNDFDQSLSSESLRDLLLSDSP